MKKSLQIIFLVLSIIKIFSQSKMINPHKSGYEKVNGINLYYEIYGSGKPLVLIHGGAGSIRFDFKEIIPRLGNKYHLIGIDLQNHGKSEHRNVPETFEQDAKDVAALLDKINIEKASFWGFSNGGTTVMQIAHLYPELTDKIIIASALFKRNGMIEGFFENMKDISIESMPESLKDNFLQLNPDVSALKNMFEKDSKRIQNFQDWDESVLKNIKSAALFICGDQDVVKSAHAVEMSELVKNSRLMILPATHGSYMMADFNGKVDEKLIDFTVSEVEKFLN